MPIAKPLTGAAFAALIVAAIPVGAQVTGDAAFAQVEKGRYLAALGDCAACHTAPGLPPFAGGVVLQTPFGNLVAPNITPDAETGVGRLSLQDFQSVMSKGIGKGGYHLYGAMPFTAYTKVTAADNAAIWAYLQTLEPARNKVEPNQLPFPFNIRASLIGWNLLNFSQGEFKPDPKQSPDWNRGAYIVEGLGHCGTCHTPKNLIGGDKNGQFLEGATLQGWFAPNITADPHKGIGAWSESEIVQYLKTGANRFDIASGPMAEVVEKSSQHWSEADLKAVAVYLKAGRNGEAKAPAPLPASDKLMAAGQAVFADRCMGCHVSTGAGVPKLFPRLAQAPLVNSDDPTTLIRVVLAGSRAGTTRAASTGPAMPSFAWNLSDQDVAAVLTYVRNSWGNAAPAVSAKDVASLRTSLQP
ncbi:mono/diheme cytochrome c family protein [Bosea sp. BE125]|uniref:c-type cytochrome n=1 Tax=Bosea sp. BE125 TaxID=2817909 RepID=UPI002867A90C|nr:cytochrome c [Bosea sp. BE125]MDR6870760.1 mono/diheme cytochrome c family protein [Bosea sp. BE125]